jgi:hypothetical protein
MAIKKALPRGKAAGIRVPKKTDISSVEEATIERVNRTLTSIEGFLAKWDSSNIKPDDLFPQVVKVRQFRDALHNWQREALKSRGAWNEQSSMRRLREFVLLCRTYS